MRVKALIVALCVYCSSLWASDLDLLLSDSRFISHHVYPGEKRLRLVWQDELGQPYRHFQSVKSALAKQGRVVRFAMNAGIFQEDLKPLGLYIENGVIQQRLSRRQSGYGNFYLQPNGVFLLKADGQAEIVETGVYEHHDDIQFATQSGPMLLVNGKVNPKFNPESSSLKIRNGVGVLSDGSLVFALSRSFIRFYDFAEYFKSLGCQQALYLDGSISRVYLPEKGIEQDGVFGPMIIEVE